MKKLLAILLLFLVFPLSSSLLPEIPRASALTMGWLTPMSLGDSCNSDWQLMSTTINGGTGDSFYHGANELHWLIYDLGSSREVTKFRWYVSNNLWTGRDKIDSCNLYVSDSLTDWGTAVATGVAFNTANQWNEITTTTKTGRFVKYASIDTNHASNYLICIEVSIYCDTENPSSLIWRKPTAVINKCGEYSIYLATKYIDGSTSASDFWEHNVDEHPHWIVLDLGAKYAIESFSNYVYSTDSTYTWSLVNIYVSDSPTGPWGSAVNYKADMTWAYTGWDTNGTLNVGTEGRYVKITIGNTGHPNDHLYGYECNFLTYDLASTTLTSAVITNALVIDSERYVFSEEKYYIFNCTYTSTIAWENITEMRMRFSDGATTCTFEYLPANDTFLLINGEDLLEHSVVRLYGGEVYNNTSLDVCVEFHVYFTRWILDALDVDIELWANATDGLSVGWSTIASDYFIIYDVGGLLEYSMNNAGSRIASKDIFDFQVDGTVGEVEANWTWRDLQHIKMLPHIEVPADRIDSQYSGEWVLWYGINYAVNGTWVNGWWCKIQGSQGYTSTKDFWIQIWVEWYRNGAMKGASEYFYSFYKPEPEKATTLFVDLWFSSANFSSVAGGRVSCEYYGMQDSVPWWKFWASDWGPMLSNMTSSEYQMDLVDGSNNLVYSQNIEMIKVWSKLEKVASTGSYAVRARDYGMIDKVFNPYGQPLQGIDKPDQVPPKVMDMPQGGWFGWLFEGLKNLLVAMSPSILSMWNTFVGFVDTIFSWGGMPYAFSRFIEAVRGFLAYIPIGFQLFAQLMVQISSFIYGFFLGIFGIFVDFMMFIPTVIGFMATLWSYADPYIGWVPATIPTLMPLIFLVFLFWLASPLLSNGDLKGTIERVQNTVGLVIKISQFMFEVATKAFDIFCKMIELIPVGE